jgi:hypothetical protein
MSREITCKLVEMAEEGILSWEAIARAALGYMSESEVADMAETEGFVEEDEDTEDWDGQPTELEEWMDFDPDC